MNIQNEIKEINEGVEVFNQACRQMFDENPQLRATLENVLERADGLTDNAGRLPQALWNEASNLVEHLEGLDYTGMMTGITTGSSDWIIGEGAIRALGPVTFARWCIANKDERAGSSVAQAVAFELVDPVPSADAVVVMNLRKKADKQAAVHLLEMLRNSDEAKGKTFQELNAIINKIFHESSSEQKMVDLLNGKISN